MKRESFSVEISTMVYPTEVDERVKQLMLSICGGRCEIKEEKFSSHYGYSFKVLSCTLTGIAAEELLRKILCSLEKQDVLSLLRDLSNHLDGRHLYLRLSKQDLALGVFKLYSGDPGGYFRLKFSFRRSDPEEIRASLMRVEEDCMRI